MLIEHLRDRSDLGVISATALRSPGVSDPWRRCGPGGPWQRMHPGVVLLHNGPPTRDQQVTAALLRAGPEAVLTGAEAGLPATGPEIHVLVPGRSAGSGRLIVERASPMPASREVGGFPVVSVERAVVDACRRLRSVDAVTALIAAVRRGRCTPSSPAAESRTNRYGTKLVREALKELGRAESVSERDARRLSRRIRLTTPHWNVTIADSDGLIIGRPGAWFDDVGLAWEIDSRAFHFGPRDYERTLARNSRCAAAGILVVQMLPTRSARQSGGGGAGVAEGARGGCGTAQAAGADRGAAMTVGRRRAPPAATVCCRVSVVRRDRAAAAGNPKAPRPHRERGASKGEPKLRRA
ncbi:hypothetical protein [Lentzea sp. NPDC004782]|uniref:hypothetical protein n=1 Tax=Lentzea sp. NPDC004782 TaxID=3154458 RepID=UPI0033A50037